MDTEIKWKPKHGSHIETFVFKMRTKLHISAIIKSDTSYSAPRIPTRTHQQCNKQTILNSKTQQANNSQ